MRTHFVPASRDLPTGGLVSVGLQIIRCARLRLCRPAAENASLRLFGPIRRPDSSLHYVPLRMTGLVQRLLSRGWKPRPAVHLIFARNLSKSHVLSCRAERSEVETSGCERDALPGRKQISPLRPSGTPVEMTRGAPLPSRGTGDFSNCSKSAGHVRCGRENNDMTIYDLLRKQYLSFPHLLSQV